MDKWNCRRNITEILLTRRKTVTPEEASYMSDMIVLF